MPERWSRDEGLTLVELLVVVVIIGILAAIATPAYVNQREKAYEASARSDVRNMVTAEIAHLADSGVYASTVADILSMGFRRDSSGEHGVCSYPGGYVVGARHKSGGSAFVQGINDAAAIEVPGVDVETALDADPNCTAGSNIDVENS